MTPDDFKGDPYGAVTNQCGHMCLGFGVTAFVGSFLPIAAIAFIYWVIVECGIQGNKLWRDGIMDTAFITAGATLAAAPDVGLQQAVILFSAALLAFEGWNKR